MVRAFARHAKGHWFESSTAHMKPEVIHEDNDIIVVNKPAGILVHPVKDEKNTLIDYFPKTKLVHRLDKDTSGLLLLAKNEKTYNWLKSQFKNRKIKKKYLALVIGKLKDKKGIITKTISKSRKRGGRQTIAPIGKKREAITRYKILKEFPNYTLLEVVPETGRTHQIRVHLASIGHPITGDEKYKFKRQRTLEGLKRQFLHASFLQFRMPNKIMKFELKLPNDLKLILENL